MRTRGLYASNYTQQNIYLVIMLRINIELSIGSIFSEKKF